MTAPKVKGLQSHSSSLPFSFISQLRLRRRPRLRSLETFTASLLFSGPRSAQPRRTLSTLRATFACEHSGGFLSFYLPLLASAATAAAAAAATSTPETNSVSANPNKILKALWIESHVVHRSCFFCPRPCGEFPQQAVVFMRWQQTLNR